MSDKKSVLNKEISFQHKTKYPTKKTINFVQDTQKATNKKAIICFIVFLLCLVPFTYYGVIGMIQKVSKAQSEYNQMQQQINTYKEQTADYSEVKAQYDDMLGTYLSEDEVICSDRMAIFNMIEEDIMPSVTVQSIAITQNQVTVQTGETTLSTVSSLLSILQSDDRNTYVTVTTASASSSNENSVIALFEITYGNGGNSDES